MKQILFAAFCIGLLLWSSADANSSPSSVQPDRNNITNSSSPQDSPSTAPISSSSKSSQTPMSTTTQAGGNVTSTATVSTVSTTPGSSGAESVLRSSCLLLLVAIPLQRMLGTVH